MDIMRKLPVELRWHVQKYTRHPIAQLLLDALEKSRNEIRQSVLDIVYPPLIITTIIPPLTIKYTLIHRVIFYDCKW